MMIASCSHPRLYFHSPLNPWGKKKNPPLGGKQHGDDKHGVSLTEKKKKNQERLYGNCFPPRHQSGKNRKNRTLSPSLIARTRVLRLFLNVALLFFILFFFPIRGIFKHHASTCNNTRIVYFSFQISQRIVRNLRSGGNSDWRQWKGINLS